MKKTLLILLIITFFACAKKKEELPPPGNMESELPPVEMTTMEEQEYIEQDIPQAPVIEEEEQRIRLTKPEEVPEPLFLGKNGQNFTFLSLKTQTIVPNDYKIGPLSSTTEEDGESLTIARKASTFINALLSGKIEKTIIAEKNVSTVVGYLSYNLNKKLIPTSFRLGKVTKKDEDKAQLNVRLFKNDGRAEGEIYLVKNKGSWMISDLRINMESLNLSYEPDSEPFLPSNYYWDLKNP